METQNGRKRTTKIYERSKRGQFKGESRSMGAFSSIGKEHEPYTLRTVGEDSDKSDTSLYGEHPDSGNVGKIARQLVSEAEKQLAYHEQQVEIIKERLKHLKQLSESEPLQELTEKEQ